MSTADATQAVSVAEPTVRAKARKRPRQGQHPLIWLAVVAIIVFCLFPFYWLLNVSLKTGADLSSSSLIPPHPTLDNYSSIFKNDDFTNGL
jgi:multiple sugar transport system permease protein